MSPFLLKWTIPLSTDEVVILFKCPTREEGGKLGYIIVKQRNVLLPNLSCLFK